MKTEDPEIERADEGKPPLVSSWRNLYTLVLVNLTDLRSPPDELLVNGKVRWQCTQSMLNKPDRSFNLGTHTSRRELPMSNILARLN